MGDSIQMTGANVDDLMRRLADMASATGYVDPFQVQTTVNNWLAQQAREDVRSLVDQIQSNGGDDAAVQRVLTDRVMQGAGDTWSGRTNDARRVYHDAYRDEVRRRLEVRTVAHRSGL